MRETKFLTIEETAQRLSTSVSGIERLVAEGKLSAYRFGGEFLRFRAEEVAILLNGHPRQTHAAPHRWERLREFVYLHDFYLLAALLILVLIVVLARFV